MPVEVTTFVTRLRSLLPGGWFSDDAPVLSAVLTCFSQSWAWLSQLLSYVKAQARLATATDIWLDIAAKDYLGPLCIRLANESDDQYRSRIQASILAPSATRYAVTKGIGLFAGTSVRIFEPRNCSDTGAYGSLESTPAGSVAYGLAYGSSGGWGSLHLPYQFFITITTSQRSGEPAPIGYGNPGGGYSAGSFIYTALSQVPGKQTDDDISRTVERLLPVNCTAWLRFS